MKEKIKHLIVNREQLAEHAQKQYKPIVFDILKSQNNDVNHISQILDYMLDFCFNDHVLQLYRLLCRYLYDFDKETAIYYVNAYREMWDEEGKMFGKNNKRLV